MTSKFAWSRAVLILSLMIATACTSATRKPFELSYSGSSDWSLVAKSSLIVDGVLTVPTIEIETAQRTSEHRYVNIDVAIRDVLKGAQTKENIAIAHYTLSSEQQPSNERLKQSGGFPLIAFLQSSERKLYFIDAGEAALVSASRERVNEIRMETERQAHILQTWRPNTSLPHYSAVSSLIARIESNTQRRSAFRELEALGVKAVPAMIAQMENYSPIPNTTLALKNLGDDAFEEHRQYGPETVVDAIAAILNQVTGESFGFIYNGGSEVERRHTVDAWRIYGMSHPAFQDSRPSISE